MQNLDVSIGKSREYTGSNRYRKDFLNKTQATQQLRERIDKWDYMKLKSCTTKEMASKLKRLPIEWENLCQLYI
jgi:hypothetical protein